MNTRFFGLFKPKPKPKPVWRPKPQQQSYRPTNSCGRRRRQAVQEEEEQEGNSNSRSKILCCFQDLQKEYDSGSSSSRSRSQSLCGWVVLVAKGRDKQMRRKSHQATPGMCQPQSSNSTALPQILWPVQAKAEAPASEPAPLRKLLLHQLEPSEQQQLFSSPAAAE